MSDPSDVLGVLGFGLAALSLTWQVAVWRLAPGRARCLLLHGALNAYGGVSGPVGKDGKPRTADLELSAAQGYGGAEVLGIEVHNVGRAPLKVTSYSAVIEGTGISLSPMGDAVGPDLPHTIDPGDSAQWWSHMTSIKEAAWVAYEGRVPTTARAHMKITTAQRQEARTPHAIRLTPPG